MLNGKRFFIDKFIRQKFIHKLRLKTIILKIANLMIPIGKTRSYISEILLFLQDLNSQQGKDIGAIIEELNETKLLVHQGNADETHHAIDKIIKRLSDLTSTRVLNEWATSQDREFKHGVSYFASDIVESAIMDNVRDELGTRRKFINTVCGWTSTWIEKPLAPPPPVDPSKVTSVHEFVRQNTDGLKLDYENIPRQGPPIDEPRPRKLAKSEDEIEEELRAARSKDIDNKP